MTESSSQLVQHSTGESGDSNGRVKWARKLDFMLSTVGYAVGLANVWRFPYLCYLNGGGAFLLPYTVMLLFAGLPLFFLEFSISQFSSLGPIKVWRLCPLFKGIGMAMVAINCMVCVYYNVILALTLYYFFAAFSSKLPWSHCTNSWNTANCAEPRSGLANVTLLISNGNSSQAMSSASTLKSPAEEYWRYAVLGMTNETNIAHIGGIRWHLCLCLLLAWVIVFLCIIRGLQSSTKVVYFTATFPYIVLLVLFVRGAMLPGAWDGISYYLKPDFSKMASVQVWKDAAVQIMFSLGPGFGALHTLASYNNFHNNCLRDAVLITIINCVTSILAGFVIFFVLGYMAQLYGVPLDQVVDKGPELAFIAYPQGLSEMPGASFWSICFFVMLFTLGLDSQFAGVECVIMAITDEYPRLALYKTRLTIGLCILLFLLGLPFITQGGMYIIELFDKFATGIPLLFVTGLEAMVVSWIYGWKQLADDIQAMLSFRPSLYWICCWLVITPAIAMMLLVLTCVEYDGIEYNGYRFPPWADSIGWLLVISSIILVPVWMLLQVVDTAGSWKNVLDIIRAPVAVKMNFIRRLVLPSSEWVASNIKVTGGVVVDDDPCESSTFNMGLNGEENVHFARIHNFPDTAYL